MEKIENKEKFKAKKTADEYVWVSFSMESTIDIIFVVLSLAFYLSYNTNPDVQNFINPTIELIQNSFDLLFISYAFLILPYVLKWVSIFGKLIRKLWVKAQTLSIRLTFKIIRVNLAVISIISVPLSYIIKQPFLSPTVLFSTLIGWALINFLFLDYSELIEIEKEYLSLTKDKLKKNIPEFSIAQILAMVLTIINISILEYVLPNGKTLGFVESEFIRWLVQDIPLSIIFFLAIIFNFLWFLVSSIGTWIAEGYMRNRQKIKFGFQILFFLALVYLFSKIAIYHLILDKEEPTASLISIIVTIITTILLKSSRFIVGFMGKYPKELYKK